MWGGGHCMCELRTKVTRSNSSKQTDYFLLQSNFLRWLPGRFSMCHHLPANKEVTSTTSVECS